MLLDRYWDKVRIGPGCWEWTAALDAGGYGRFQLDGKSRKAHRLMRADLHGDIPSGLQVCHRCDNPSCVRPEHLFLGTARDNVQDAWRKGRGRNPRPNAGRTECQRGHALDESNTYVAPDGKRRCRTCFRSANGAWARARRAA